MKFIDFLPYYGDLKMGALFACSYVGAIAGLCAMFLLERILALNFPFSRLATFSLVASGALWLAPITPFLPKQYSNLELAGMLLMLLPIFKFSFQCAWKKSAILWGAYALAQSAIYLYIINNI